MVSKIRADFQNYHIWAWNLAIGQSARSCTYSLSTPEGSKLSLFSLYGQHFLRYGMIIKIAIFGHETQALSKVPGYMRFLPQRVEIELIFALWAVVSELLADFQNCHIWAWILVSGPSARSYKHTLFLPQGIKIELIFALRYGPIFKTAIFMIFGHETWPLTKVPEVAHVYTLFLPQGVKIELIFALRAVVSVIWADSQNCHIWAWNLAIGQSSRNCTYTS